MKKVKFFSICFLFVFGLAQSRAEQIQKVVAPIVDKAQVGMFNSSGYYGFQYYSAALNINLSGLEFSNLALKMRVYVENFNDPDDLSFITSAGFHQIEFASDYNVSGVVKYLTWQIKPLNLHSGWQDVLLPLSTGNNSGIDVSKINFFRFCLAQIPNKPDGVQIRLKDVNIVDTTEWVEPPVVVDPTWNTDYMAAALPYTLNGTYSNGFSIGQSFAAVDVSAHNPQKLALMMDIDVDDLAAPGDVSILGRVSGQVELTSSGHADAEEISWGIASLNWTAGKHTYTLALSSASNSGVAGSGNLDVSRINYMRMYAVSVPADYTGSLRIKVDNVRIVDLTNETRLPTIFGNGMIFQQNKDINVWGYAETGKQIKVEWYKNDVKLDEKTDIAAGDGKWLVTFPPETGSYSKYKLVILENGNTIQTISDILIGEVWLASGQSNMAYSVSGTLDVNEQLSTATNNNIRFFLEPTYPASGSSGKQPYYPEKDIAGAYWGAGDNSAQVTKLSAVAYRMAYELQPALNVPVGILNVAVGGSIIEAWLPREEVDSDPNLVLELQRRGLYYNEDWWVDAPTTLTSIHNQKVAPLEGYNIRCSMWYLLVWTSGSPVFFEDVLLALKKGYERIFGFAGNDMPFIFAQVCPWLTETGNPQFLAYLAESMTDAWAAKPASMAMLPLYDLDLTYNPDPIHPINKTPVGKRFAVAAKNLVYNGTDEYTAPVFESLEIRDGKAIVKFDRTGTGLQGINGATDLHGFAVSGSDGVFVNAKARIISANEVEVWNDRVSAPAYVTYAFATYNTGSNLANSAGIPATPFRSDRLATGQKYLNPADWTYADGQVWGGYANESGTNVVGFSDTWRKGTISGTAATLALSFDETHKSEGKASLKADYTPDTRSTVGISPVYSTVTVIKQFENFKTISIDILNPDGRDKEMELLIRSGANVYKVPVADQTATSNLVTKAVLKGGQGFTTCTFDLTRLTTTTGAVIANPLTQIKSLLAMQFTVYDDQAGTVYIDNVMFGMEMKESSSIGSIPDNNSDVSVSASNSQIVISASEPIRKIEITDLQGKVIRSVNPNHFVATLNAPAKNTAVFAKIRTDNSLKVRKIITR